ncbi:MAG: hypothetical protein IKV26_00130 [Paludibacteraceae bacterium]|nr:hypothetical protein [Paludibacteraceae bacterium]
MFFFSSNNSGQKRDLALLHASLLIIKANPNPTQFVKLGQDAFIRTLSGGLSRSNPLFTQKAENMSDLEMASILRNLSNFDKRSIAQTLSAAFYETGRSPESKNVLIDIAYECDIPLNYFRI